MCRYSDTDIDPLFLSLVKIFKTSLASSSARPRHLGTLCSKIPPSFLPAEYLNLS